MTPETKHLIEAVKFFAISDDHKCWPTTKRWTVKEAKDALAQLAKLAADSEKKAAAQ